MKRLTPIRRDEILLKMAKNVFGDDLVTDAYVCTWINPGVSPQGSEIIRLNNQQYKTSDVDKEKGFSFDMNHIRLIFCNGKIVDFHSSEWASIFNPDDDSYEA